MKVKKWIKTHKNLDIALIFLEFKEICKSPLNATKATKIMKIDFKMSKICLLEVKGVNVWFRHTITS
jgi:hypothetical protein